MQDASYHLAVFGTPPEDVIGEITQELDARLAILSLRLGEDVALYVGMPEQYDATSGKCTAALCFPLPEGQDRYVVNMMANGIPVIPIASRLEILSIEFPPTISVLNGLGRDKADTALIVNCLLECASLLPRQRRVFLSYRRTESTSVALQLYAALSARQFDVFLDTHDILPGEHFQEVLWQKLCDSDVLLYLDTPDYFNSRWTTAEFGRATWRGTSIQRVGWPGVPLDDRSQISSDLQLTAKDFAEDRLLMKDECIARICRSVEDLRAESVATRYNLLMDALRVSIRRSRGEIEGCSLRRSFTVKTARGQRISVYPALGVPTTHTLHDATLDQHVRPIAVVYDNEGIEERGWSSHMDWIGQYLKDDVRLIGPYGSGWKFEDWH